MTRRGFGGLLAGAALAAPMDLRAMREQYRRDLFDVYVPFHE